MRINNTTKKYIVFPGEVKSIFDGEIHYISGHQLIRLYKLNPKEVIIANEDRSNLVGINRKEFIKLYPRRNGNY